VQGHCIPHMFPEGRDEKQVRARFGFHRRPVEVEGPTLGLDL
jgi:hypothetical protein